MHSFAQSTVLLAHPGNQPLHVHREFRSDASPQTEQENRLGRIRGVGLWERAHVHTRERKRARVCNCVVGKTAKHVSRYL